MNKYSYLVRFINGQTIEIESEMSLLNFCGHLCLAGDFVILGGIIYAKASIESVELV